MISAKAGARSPVNISPACSERPRVVVISMLTRLEPGDASATGVKTPFGCPPHPAGMMSATQSDSRRRRRRDDDEVTRMPSLSRLLTLPPEPKSCSAQQASPKVCAFARTNQLSSNSKYWSRSTAILGRADATSWPMYLCHHFVPVTSRNCLTSSAICGSSGRRRASVSAYSSVSGKRRSFSPYLTAVPSRSASSSPPATARPSR